MDSLTRNNRDWLDQRFDIHEGAYVAHQPIYGFGQGMTEGAHLQRLCRTLNIFRSALPLQPASILDVGGAEGYSMSLARHLMGGTVVVTDLSRNACRRAREFWGLRAAAVDATRLPFADNAFDLVWCSEVIEHLAHPFRTLAELLRVAGRYVLITTDVVFPWVLQRAAALKTRAVHEPHFDRNLWTPHDFRALFGPSVAIRPQFALSATGTRATDADACRSLALALTTPRAVRVTTQGVIVVVSKGGNPAPAPTTERDEEILDLLLRGPIHACTRREECWQQELLATVRCPDCGRAPSLRPGDEARCSPCDHSFGRIDDVLDLLPSRAIAAADADEQAAIRELVADEGRRAHLLGLADRFEIANVARMRAEYLVYRGLRWALNQGRWAAGRALGVGRQRRD